MKNQRKMNSNSNNRKIKLNNNKWKQKLQKIYNRNKKINKF